MSCNSRYFKNYSLYDIESYLAAAHTVTQHYIIIVAVQTINNGRYLTLTIVIFNHTICSSLDAA